MKMKEAGQCYHEELDTKESEDTTKNLTLIDKNGNEHPQRKSDVSSTQSGDAMIMKQDGGSIRTGNG
jgi:hypothetical protein